MKEAPVLIWVNLWIKAYDAVSGCCSLLFSLIVDQAPGPHPKFLKQHSSFFFSLLLSISSEEPDKKLDTSPSYLAIIDPDMSELKNGRIKLENGSSN